MAFATIWLLVPSILNRSYLIIYGFSGVALSFAASIVHATDGFRGKMTAKLLLGSGFAALCFAVLLYGDSIFAEFDFKILVILALYFPVMFVLNAKRLLETSRECNSCEFKMRWSRCPGFRELVCRLLEKGFVRPASIHPQTAQ